jgi:membrane associated rhomboid family serine protease
MNDSNFKFSPSVLAWPLYFVLLLWGVYWLEIKFFDLTQYGIYPRTLTGLRGIIFSPFLHGGIEHLYNNSIPLFLLVAALRYFYRNQALRVLVYGILVSGFITWLIARPSYHIGASGLIYVLVSFIFFKGIKTGYYRLVALSLLIIMLYGGMIWYVFPDVEEGISWEGHLAGLITGFLFSVFFVTPEYQKELVYEWEQPGYDPQQDPFMKRFDANGNFVNPPRPEDIEVIDAEIVSPNPGFKIVYTYRTDNEDGDLPAQTGLYQP